MKSMKNMKKQVLRAVLFGCMMLPIEQAQASSPLFFSSKYESSGSPSSVAGLNFDQKLSENQIVQILENRLAVIGASTDINAHLFARTLFAPTYAELEKIIDVAQNLAIEDASNVVTMKHLEDAEKYIAQGPADNFILKFLAYDYKRKTAIHEAGHAVTNVYKNQKTKILHDVTIVPRTTTIGIANANSISQVTVYTIEMYRNEIIRFLSGGVAQQVFGLPESFAGKNLSQLLLNFDCSSDIELARSRAVKILDCQVNELLQQVMALYAAVKTEQEKEVADFAWNYYQGQLVNKQEDQAQRQLAIDAIIADCYEETWNFIIEHQDDINKVANLLLEKYTISGDDVYNLLGVDKPLYDFQEGPLPESLAANYELRGHTPNLKVSNSVDDLDLD